MKLTHSVLFAGVLAMSCGLAGCSFLKPKADPTQFYVLRVQSAEAAPAAAGLSAPPEIRVGPGRIPGYLDNSPIAIENGPNRVEYLGVYYWAEPLSKGVSRVLAENLARKFAPANLTVHPNLPLTDSGYEIRYTVERLEGTLAGPVTLEVSWQLLQRSSGEVIAAKRSEYVVPAQGRSKDVAAYVERLSAALALWADDVAATLGRP